MLLPRFIFGFFFIPQKNSTENHDSEAIDAIILQFFANTN
jgi:hypothetical protein